MRTRHALLMSCVLSVVASIAWPSTSLADGQHASGAEWNVKLLSAPVVAGESGPLRFQLRQGASKTPTTAFEPAHERLLHAWLIRDTPNGGFADFQHVHPSLTSGGTWELADARLSKSGTWNLVVDATSSKTQRYGFSTFDIGGTDTRTDRAASDYRASISELGRHDGMWMATVQVRDPSGRSVDSTQTHIGASAHWPMFVRTEDGAVKVVHAHASGPISPKGEFEFMFEMPAGAKPETVLDGWLEFRPTGDDPQILPLAPGAPAYQGSSLLGAVAELIRATLPRIPVDSTTTAAAEPAAGSSHQGGQHG